MADDEPLMQMRTTRRAEVAVSLEDMYRLLVAIDSKVTTLTVTVNNAGIVQKDHEQRLRDLENGRLSEGRIAAMEDDVKAIRAEQESMKRKLYGIPSISAIVAVSALVITLIRWL